MINTILKPSINCNSKTRPPSFVQVHLSNVYRDIVFLQESTNLVLKILSLRTLWVHLLPRNWAALSGTVGFIFCANICVCLSPCSGIAYYFCNYQVVFLSVYLFITLFVHLFPIHLSVCNAIEISLIGIP